MARYLYSELARTIEARRNSAQNIAKQPDASNSKHWFDRHTETIERLVKQHMPSGSGFDNGTALDLDASHADKLVFHTAFHHMDEAGGYDGWTEHTVTVTPALGHDYHLRISGRNRNDIKEMMYEEFAEALRTDVTYDLFIDRFPQYRITSKWEDQNGAPSQCEQSWFVLGDRYKSYTQAREWATELIEKAIAAPKA